jgi:glycosyltransferase involved in cell wall biosynthesis
MVVDDGSTDGTLAVAEELAALYPRTVRVLSHPDHVNRGVSISRNLGITQSTGELICFLDADDYVFPHRFSVCVPLLAQDAGIDGIYELTRMQYENGVSEAAWSDTGSGDLFGITAALGPEELIATLLRGVPWHPGAFICRRAFLQRTGLFHEQLRIAEDCHLWFRMAAAGRIAAGNLSRPVSAYVRHARNTFNHSLERKVDMVRAMTDAWRWVRRNATPERQIAFQRGMSGFIINGLIVARESSRRDVAWRIIRTALGEGYHRLLLETAFLRQAVWLCRETLTGGKAREGNRS